MRRRVVTAACLLALAAAPAWAVDPFEIQVYEGDINDPLQPGIELHTNFVASGRSASAFDGELVPDKRLNVTFEPSFGILPWWEVGAYLQFATAPSRSDSALAGFKLRSKFIVPKARTTPFVVGVNFEVGRGTHALGSEDWDTEMRPIFAYEISRWFFAVNPILGWALSGSTHAVPEFEPAAKVRFDTRLGFGVGIEYYAGLGRLDDILPASAQQHVAYLIGDLMEGPVALNVGLGRGLTDATEDWIVKLILGYAF